LFANVEKRVELHQFLDILYRRYGLVFGERQAEYALKKSGFDKEAFARLSQLIEIKLPAHFVGHIDLPLDVLTNERTIYFRNAACEKPALLLQYG
jgi:hypothetical protein